MIDRVDRAIGDGIATAVRAKHRRRLARLSNTVLDAPAGRLGRGWAASPAGQSHGGADRRRGGARRMAIAEIQGDVASSHLSGWFLSPGLRVARGPGAPIVVRNLLAELARRADVRVLLWAGAPLPVFRPSRRIVRRVRDELPAGRADPLRPRRPRTAASLPSREDDRGRRPGRVRRWYRPDERGGDRRDGSAHTARAELGWHDAAPSSRGRPLPTSLRTSGCGGARSPGRERAVVQPPRLRRMRGRCSSSGPFPSASIRAMGRGSFGILESYARAPLRRTPELIYLEFAVPVVARGRPFLAGKLRRSARAIVPRTASCSRAGRRAAPTTPAAPSPSWSPRTRGAGRVLACRLSAQRPGRRPDLRAREGRR